MKGKIDYGETYSNDNKILEERTKYKIYCKCGHSMIIYPFEHTKKKICSYCGHYLYQNKKEEFKDRLLQKKKVVESENT